MEGKKISFGFLKTKKVEKLPVQEKKDFIECLEGKAIKVVGGDEVKVIAPLIIPMKPNTLMTTERLKEIAEKVESALEEPEIVEKQETQEKVPENETLEQMAVRELLEDSKKTVETSKSLTLLLPSKSAASSEKESTLDDYDNVPVKEFGLAMLRGMGWTKDNEKSKYKLPELRPKGLGLGADKVVKDKQKTTKNSKDEELTIVKNAYIKITNGKYSGYYGKVLSLDEDNGRVMVDIVVKKETVSLSEFMMHPVTKSEFDKESKVINANSFEQYKKNEEQKSYKNSGKESSVRDSQRNNREYKSKPEESNTGKDNTVRRTEGNRDRSNREKHRDSSEEIYKNKKNKRYSSQESLSDSDSDRNLKNEQKSKKYYGSMDSLNSDSETDYRSKKTNKDHKDSNKESKRDKERRRHDSDLESDRKSKKVERESKRYSSDSESDHKNSKKGNKDTRNDSDSDHRRSKKSDTPEGKRDIDKKRKGKKKKRDRDRSPNYRKHRK